MKKYQLETSTHKRNKKDDGALYISVVFLYVHFYSPVIDVSATRGG